MSLSIAARLFRIWQSGCLVLSLVALLISSGCWVDSVNGLEEKDFLHEDQDLTFDPTLVGAWQVTSDNCKLILTISGDAKTYELETAGQGEGCNDSGKEIEYHQGRLLKLDNHYFLDMSPRPDAICEMCLPLHWIFLVRFDKDALSLTPIDDEWLKHALEQGTVTLATMPGNTDRLTASSKDLKGFCRKYADNKEVFKPVPGLSFTRKQG